MVAVLSKGTPNQALQQTGAACSGFRVQALSAAPAAELWRSAAEGLRVAIVDTLFHRRPNRHEESWMPTEEVLRRVAVRFPLATIDQERGDRRIIAEADNLAELAGPSHLVELHRKMVGRVAYVTICDEASGPRFGFILRDTPFSIEIEYERLEDREVCRPLLEALAAELAEYDIVTEDIED